MVERRRTYDKEFKLMAVELSESPSSNVKQVAKELDLRSDLIYHWRRQFKRQGERSFLDRIIYSQLEQLGKLVNKQWRFRRGFSSGYF